MAERALSDVGPTVGRMEIRIDAVGVLVSDMAAAVAFYRRLGCDFPAGAETEGHAEAVLGGGVRLMLDSEASLAGLGMDTTASSDGRVSLAAGCASAADVDAVYEALARDGFGVTAPWDAPWGQRYAVARDPDGTHVDLYAPLPA